MKRFGTGPNAVEIKKIAKNIYSVVEVGDIMKHFAGLFKARSYKDAYLAYIREPFGNYFDRV